ncbi:10178_t:CDS:1 [Cetraspora pellucida]|uniref:10178_t:CDS:1 n=1 Tax=Cetraspora pellucida TaxID=1433469 RepID=A0A9N9NUZ3_9GLOM|nr:10178_t:CDS:1 [Cetraspora pellucida]
MPRQTKSKNIRDVHNKLNIHETQVNLPDIELRSPFLPVITVEELCKLKRFSPHDNKPGQSPNSFIIYKMELHREIKKTNVRLGDFSKIASKLWENEPECVKIAYRKLAEAVKSEHKKKFPFVFLQDKIKEHYVTVDSDQPINVNQATNILNKIEVDNMDYTLNVAEFELAKCDLAKCDLVDNVNQVAGAVKVDHFGYDFNVAEAKLAKLNLVDDTIQAAGAIKVDHQVDHLDYNYYNFTMTEVESANLNLVNNTTQMAGAVMVDRFGYDFNMAEIESAKVKLVDSTIQMGKDTKMIDIHSAVACQVGEKHEPRIIEEFYIPMSDNISSTNPFVHFSDSDLRTPSFDYQFYDHNCCINKLFFLGNPSYSPESSLCCYPLPHKNSFNP